MDRNKMSSEQVIKEIEKLVRSIQSYDGSSGHAEEAWMKDQQELVRLLSEHPTGVYKLSDEMKGQVQKIVSGYLDWSFNGCW